MQLFNRIITIITYKFLARLKYLETMKVWCIWERHADRQTVCKRNLGMGLFDVKIFMNCYKQIWWEIFHELCTYLQWQWTVSGLRTKLACETHVHNLNYETVTELCNGVQLSRLSRLLLGKLCFASKREETSTVHTISEWLGKRDCWTRSMWRILEWLVLFECLGGAATRTSGLEVSVCT